MDSFSVPCRLIPQIASFVRRAMRHTIPAVHILPATSIITLSLHLMLQDLVTVSLEYYQIEMTLIVSSMGRHVMDHTLLLLLLM